MSFLNGLLRTLASTNGVTYLLRSKWFFDSGNVTLTDVPADDAIRVSINTATLAGTDGIQRTTANIDAWEPTGANVKSYFAALTDTTTTNATPTLIQMPTEVDVSYTSAVMQVSALVTAWRNDANCATFRRSRSFVIAAGVTDAIAASSNDGSASIGTGSAWSIELNAGAGADDPPTVTVTGAAATTIKWRGVVQVTIGVGAA